jgi:hypothetical protein
MSQCYHRGVREQWYLYLRLTPAALLCASKEKGESAGHPVTSETTGAGTANFQSPVLPLPSGDAHH